MKMLENSLFLCVKVKVEVLEIKEHRSFWCRDILIIIHQRNKRKRHRESEICPCGRFSGSFYMRKIIIWSY